MVEVRLVFLSIYFKKNLLHKYGKVLANGFVTSFILENIHCG